MEIKTFEIRDAATFIPAVALRADVGLLDGQAAFLFRSAGWGYDQTCTYLFPLQGRDEVQYDPFKWHGDSRTFYNAHVYIRDHWRELDDGAVIDVEFILGEHGYPKESQRVEHERQTLEALRKLGVTP